MYLTIKINADICPWEIIKLPSGDSMAITEGGISK